MKPLRVKTPYTRDVVLLKYAIIFFANFEKTIMISQLYEKNIFIVKLTYNITSMEQIMQEFIFTHLAL